MSGPKWAPVDEETSDLLSLVATGPLAPPTADEEWVDFQRCLRTVAAENGGLVLPNALRPLVRGHIAPRRIGAFTNRALAQGLVEYTGDWETSNDLEGRNAGKPARIMRLLAPASIDAESA